MFEDYDLTRMLNCTGKYLWMLFFLYYEFFMIMTKIIYDLKKIMCECQIIFMNVTNCV